MAKNLNDLILRNDLNGRQIRCLIVEDEITGTITKVRDKDEISTILETVEDDYLTKVYEPTIEERNELLELMKSSLITTEEGELEIEVSEEETLLTLFKFTDIHIDKRKNKKNLDLVKKALKKPTITFISIKQELESIMLEVVSMYYSMLTTYNNISSDIDKIQKEIHLLEHQISNQEQEKMSMLQEIEQLENTFNRLDEENEQVH